MLQSINVSKAINAVLLIIIATVLIKISGSLSLRSNADDQYFLSALNSFGLLDYIIFRYEAWSGRATLEALMVLTIGHKWFWKVAIPLTLLLLSCSISRVATGKASIHGSLVALALLIGIPSIVNNDAAWWITGYYNYLLPVCAAIYTLSVMLDDRKIKFEIIASFICVFLFSYSEQSAVAFLIASSVIMIMSKKHRNKYLISIFTLCVINFLVLMKAPGNYARLQSETWHWMPEFSEYTFTQKMALGFEKVHQSFVIEYNIPVIFLSLVLIAGYIKSGKKSASGNVAALISSAFVIFSLIASFNGYVFNKFFFSSVFMTSEKWYLMPNYASYFFIMLFISAVITLIISSSLTISDQVLSVSSFLIGCISVFMVGFSPTVYASLLRVAYLFEVCCILAAMTSLKSVKAP